MHQLQLIWKFIWKFVLSFLGLLLIFALIAALLSILPSHKNYQAPEAGIPIYLSTNGIHADFILPVQTQYFDWHTAIDFTDFQLKDRVPTYVAFGWGDKGFYLETPTWEALTMTNLLKALFWKSETAMHVTYYSGTPKESENCIRLLLSPEQFQTLNTYILDSFEKTKNGSVKLLSHPGYGDRDRFYEATGSYHLIETCNVWVNRGLKKIGVKTAVWTPFDWGIFWHLQMYE